MAIRINKLNMGGFRFENVEIPDLSIDTEDEAPVKPLSTEERLRRYIDGIGITACTGVEGSGKTLMMTRLADTGYKLGAKIYHFPGYALLDPKTGKELSTPLNVEDWANMPDWLRDCIICGDEWENFFNSHKWQSIMVDLFTGVFGERRKRHLGIIYTVQFFREIPTLMRLKTHYVYECRDASKYNKFTERQYQPGEKTFTNIIDSFGNQGKMIPGARYPGPTFRNKKYFDCYKTESVVSIFEKYTKVEIKRKKVGVDLDGDGQVSPEEEKASEIMFNRAKNALIHAFETKKQLKGTAYWNAAGLNSMNKAHQKIAAELNELLGIEKDARGTYKRDFALVNS